MVKFKNRNLILLLSLVLATSMMFTGCLDDQEDASSGDTDTAEVTESADNSNNKEKTLSEEEVEEKISEDYDNGIVFDEEMDGYEVKVDEEPGTKFIGKWEATSGNAHYLLGNLDLNIKASGRWKGNVAGDDLSGTWIEKDGGIELRCNDPNINFGGTMVFTPKGTLVYSYYPFEDSTEPNTIVLTKK